MTSNGILNALSALEAWINAAQVQAAINQLDEEGEILRTGERAKGKGKSPPLQPIQRVAYLADVDSAIKQFKYSLEQHPELVEVFEKSIRSEFKQRERRSNVAGFVINIVCTLIGAGLGIVLQNVLVIH